MNNLGKLGNSGITTTVSINPGPNHQTVTSSFSSQSHLSLNSALPTSYQKSSSKQGKSSCLQNPFQSNIYQKLEGMLQAKWMEQRLNKLDKKSGDRAKFVNDPEKFRTKHIKADQSKANGNPSYIQSSYLYKPDEFRKKDGRFVNKYTEHEWEFRQNFRKGFSSEFYANDVVRMQYRKVSQDEGFFGKRPSVITRKNITNEITLNAIHGEHLKDDPAELMRVFLKTPNGASTQRIMDDFDLQPTKVTIRYKGEGNCKQVDVLIDVIPKKNIKFGLGYVKKRMGNAALSMNI